MTPEIQLIASIAASVGIVGIVLMLFRGTRRRGKQLAIAGFLVCFGASAVSVYRDDISASEAGFKSGEDLRAAKSEGVTDPSKWKEIVEKRRDAKQAATAKEVEQKQNRAEEEQRAQFHPRYVAFENAKDTMHVSMMSSAMNEIKKRLRDPKSAQFRNVRLVTGSTDVTVTCGDVNSKNGFGGYAGYSSFVSNGVSVTYLASDFKKPEEFLKLWNTLCN